LGIDAAASPALRGRIVGSMHDAPISLSLTTDREAIAAGETTRITVIAELTAAQAGLEARRAPLNLMLALDVSPSMRGQPLAQAVRSIEMIVELARPSDRLGLVTFAQSAELVLPLETMASRGPRAWAKALSRIQLRQATNIAAGLRVAAEGIDPSRQGEKRAVLLLSDGQPNVDLVGADRLAELAAGLRSRAAISTLGYGPDHDDLVLAAVAEAGGGAYRFIPDPASCRFDLIRAFGAQADLVAQEVSLELVAPIGVELGTIFPAAGLARGAPTRIAVPDLTAGQSRSFVVELQIPARGAGEPAELLQVDLQYLPAGGRQPVRSRQAVRVAVAATAGGLVIAARHRALAILADRARQQARELAEGGSCREAADLLQAFIGEIEATPGYRPIEGELLFEVREQLWDDVQLFLQRPDAHRLGAFRRGQRASFAAGGAFAGSARVQTPEAKQIALALAGVDGRAFFVLPGGARIPAPIDGVIGRSHTADVPLASGQVSRQHARVFALEGEFFLADLGSTNPTCVNGRPIDVHRLSDQDRVEIGDQVLLFINPPAPAP
jgi:Mg-chelatase subunit ChlD